MGLEINRNRIHMHNGCTRQLKNVVDFFATSRAENVNSQVRQVDNIFTLFSTKDASYNNVEGVIRMYIHGHPIHLHLPTPYIKSGEYSVEYSNPMPAHRPKIEWVYGYRGKDARLNLHLLPTGEIVYFVAAVVVLFNADEHAQRHYLGHTGEIKW